ncbi:hypothetical protein [Polyangium aurulentum]|uniref:hypothetical protein n=1 Tax=Polyangium aurulentum TaxID=2567896 RepID=UPI0010AE1E54|nr:hypothetical protein [Polyangium aurulentum]UQA57352.1 hypothetical protein E8A73_039680 [Polyangium aurulentum]
MTGLPPLGVHRWTQWMAAIAALALGGCTFGDEPGRANDVVGDWFDDNCVPVECLFECCQGWNYSKDPLLHGGSVYGLKCEETRTKNSAYAEYVALMGALWNKCPSDFNQLETGYCAVINPPDVIEGFNLDGQPVYANLSFLVCPPRGQPAAHPLEDVALIPQE